MVIIGTGSTTSLIVLNRMVGFAEIFLKILRVLGATMMIPASPVWLAMGQTAQLPLRTYGMVLVFGGKILRPRIIREFGTCRASWILMPHTVAVTLEAVVSLMGASGTRPNIWFVGSRVSLSLNTVILLVILRMALLGSLQCKSSMMLWAVLFDVCLA